MNQNLSAAEQFVAKIDAILGDQLADENFGVSELCEKVGLSRSQLHRKLKKLTGSSTSTYIRKYRLSKAHDLLKNDTGTASEIAYQVGFSSPSYFHTAFKNEYGYTPGEAKFHEVVNPAVPKKSKAPIWIGWGIVLIGALLYFGYKEFDSNTIKDVFVVNYKEKSIAVLAFKDLSDDQDQKFLGMSLAAEVINILDDVEGLKVIGQTSSFSLMDKNLSLDSIAKLLNVNYILEGTIIESDGSIDVIAVLSDGETGQTMISPKYSIESDDALSVRREIAKQVAYELKMKVKEDAMAASGRSDAQVKTLEQKIFYEMSKGASDKTIRDLCDECISLDSTYLPCIAWRGKFAKSQEEQIRIKDWLIELDSTSEYTYFINGEYYLFIELDFKNAYLNYKKMLATEPSDSRMMSEAAYNIGHFDVDLGAMYLNKLMESDPLYYKNYIHLMYMNFFKGDFLRAVEMIDEKTIMTDGTYPWERIYMYIAGGYREEAIIALSELKVSDPPGWSEKTMNNFVLLTELFIDAGHIDNKTFYERYLKLREMTQYDTYVYAGMVAFHGNKDLAFYLLEDGFREKRGSIFFKELKYSPWFKDMHDDPRWPVFLSKVGMPGY